MGWFTLARAVLVQGAGLLPKLRRSTHDRAGRAPRGRGAAARTRAAVGSHNAPSPPVPPRLEPQALPRGTGGVCPGDPPPLPPPRTPARPGGRARRRPHRDPALRGGAEPERPLPHAPAP